MSASVACNNHAIINLSKQTKIVHDTFVVCIVSESSH